MHELKISTERVLEALEYRDYKFLRNLFKENPIPDVAEAFSELEMAESIVLFRLVPRTRRVELFSYLNSEQQENLIMELPDVISTSLLNEMDPDDRTKLFEELPIEIRNKILLKLDPEERQIAWKLLSYPENSVGRMMTPDLLVLNDQMQVSQAIEMIRWSSALPVEFLNYFFVTNKEGKLVGEISLAMLIVCEPQSATVREKMQKNVVSLHPNLNETEAVEIFRKYDRNYIPVADEENKILGIVTADDVFDVAEDEATEDIQQFGGQESLEDSYFLTPLFTMLKKRVGWLAFLFLSGFITCKALQSYEETLAKWSFLIFFVPMITSAGGNSGTQAASLIIRGLAIKEMSSADAFRILKKEALVGLLLGSILATLGYIGAITWGMGSMAGTIVSLALIGVVLFGVVAGSMLPFLFKLLKLDPAVVSSPFISTLMDVTGVVLYLKIAIYMMS